MKFSLEKSIEILEQTPRVLSQLLPNLSAEWTSNNEGDGTWSPFDVVGHLIHAEKTNWLVRAALILSDCPDKTFGPFDRFAQFEASKGKSILQLLDDFKAIRAQNIIQLKQWNLTEEQIQQTGIHPTLGVITLSNLLSTWVVHDLDHISQICRVMAKQYTVEVGSWIEFLKILKQ